MTQKILYTALTALTLGATAAAQDLSTVVTVDRTVVPAERAATRPSDLTPTLVMPAAPAATIRPMWYTDLSEITRTYPRLDPAEGAMAPALSPYRGYVSLGYFPSLTLGGAAGYRFIDTDSLTLGATVTLDGDRYAPVEYPDGHNTQQYWSAGAAVATVWRPAAHSRLSARVAYDWMRQESSYWAPLSLNSGSMALGWKSRASVVDYNIDARVALEKAGDSYIYISALDQAPALPGLAQQQYTVSAAASAAFAQGSRAGLSVDADFVHTGTAHHNYQPDDATIGAIGVTPYYAYTSAALCARVGVRVDLGSGGEGSKVNVAPEINVQWAPASTFAVEVSATGGSVMNPFSSLRAACPYQVFLYAYDRSYVPLRVEGRLNFGPFTGFTASVYGGYAKANRWLMLDNAVIDYVYDSVNISGWKAGLELGWEWRWLTASARVEATPGNARHAWLENRDRATTFASATVAVRPIERLQGALTYEYRGGRKAMWQDMLDGGGSHTIYLGNINSLGVRVSYAFTPALTVFANVDNITGHRYEIIPGQWSHRQTGLVGVAAKF